jgi:peptide/nickel transport system substrate-binding protein
MNNDTLRGFKAMMSDHRQIFLTFSVLLSFVLVTACGGPAGDMDAVDGSNPTPGEWVVLHELSDAEGLNPFVTNDATATNILNHVYDRLLIQHWETLELIPQLCEARPTVSEDHLQYTFKLKDGVTFSDGSPLTTKDVIFSFKAVKNPLVIDAAALRNYYLDIKDVVAHDDLSFTVTMSQPYFLAEYFIGGLWILSKKHLDPKNLTDKFSFAETNDLTHADKNPALKAHAAWFNSSDVKRSTTLNVGSGPYVYEAWNTGESIILKRNDKWWGAGTDPFNPAHPGKIIYKTVNDRNSAVVAVKNQEIDFMEALPAAKFTEEVDTVALPYLRKNAYRGLVYNYIGWNTRRPLFADKRVRHALSHLVDRDALIKQVRRGLGEITNSPVYRGLPEYDESIKGIPYDPAKARALLAEAGWKDTDNDGVLDKVVDGRKQKFTFKFLLNSGNEEREQVMLILADEFKKVGIRAEIQKLEWSVFLENLRTREFDAYVGAWVNDPIPTDPYQLWHSSQASNNGSNYTGFSNERADKLIEMNRTEFDEAKRIKLMHEFQRIVVDEQPYTFMWMYRYPSVYNKRLQNVNFSLIRPGYDPSQWWVPKAQWRLAAAP